MLGVNEKTIRNDSSSEKSESGSEKFNETNVEESASSEKSEPDQSGTGNSGIVRGTAGTGDNEWQIDHVA